MRRHLTLVTTPPTDWRDDAPCRGMDPSIFFPSQRGAVVPPHVLRMCRERCHRRDACIEHALTAGEAYGWWGGLSPHALRRLRSARAVEVAEPRRASEA